MPVVPKREAPANSINANFFILTSVVELKRECPGSCSFVDEWPMSNQTKNVCFWHLADIPVAAINVRPFALHMSAYDPKRTSLGARASLLLATKSTTSGLGL
jgi:hypothetical protein